MNLNEISDSESDSLYKIESINLPRPNKVTNQKLNNNYAFCTKDHEHELKCKLDTDATCNVLHLKDYNKIHMGKNMYGKEDTNLRQSDTML